MLHTSVDVQPKRLRRVQGFEPEPYVNNVLQRQFVPSATKEVLPEDARLPARLRPVGDYARRVEPTARREGL